MDFLFLLPSADSTIPLDRWLQQCLELPTVSASGDAVANRVCFNAHNIFDEFAAAHIVPKPRNVMRATEVREALADFVRRKGYPDVDPRSATQSMARLGFEVFRRNYGTAYFGAALANLPDPGVASSS